MMINPHQKIDDTTLEIQKPGRVFSLKSWSPFCSCIISTSSITHTILLHMKIKQQTSCIPKLSHTLKSIFINNKAFSQKALLWMTIWQDNKWFSNTMANNNKHPFHIIALKTFSYILFYHTCTQQISLPYVILLMRQLMLEITNLHY